MTNSPHMRAVYRISELFRKVALEIYDAIYIYHRLSKNNTDPFLEIGIIKLIMELI